MLLVLDVSNLCHRSWHTARKIPAFKPTDNKDENTLILLFFKSLIHLMSVFNTKENEVIFCFDGEGDLNQRKKLLPEYKLRTITSETDKTFIYKKIKQLREKILPNIGFNNLLHFPFWEADDIIADIAKKNKCIIVSNDGDLLQCLRPGVTIWNPITKHQVTAKEFKQSNLDIEPSKWAHVKSLTGCVSDNIPGIPGIGERTAIKYLTGELNPNTESFKSIILSKDLIERNLTLTMLPHPNYKENIKFTTDNVTKEKWDKVFTSLKMLSLINKCPI